MSSLNHTPGGSMPRGCVLFRFWMMVYVLCCIGIESYGHTIVLAEYTLEYKNEHWQLSFHQKTSQLRDAIYASDPELKGLNLNSATFHQATLAYVEKNLMLTSHGSELRLKPQSMHYGGLRFESSFIVEGLSQDASTLTVEARGFDTHAHSIILFRVMIGKEGYLHYFNRQDTRASFDFGTHRYDRTEAPRASYRPWLVAVITLMVGISVGLFLRPMKRPNSRPVSAQ